MQEDFSPWGQIQYSETLIPGMELVTIRMISNLFQS